MIANNGVYGSHYEKGALYLSLVRGVSYCAHPISDRPILPENRFVKKVDQGENAFSFRLGVIERNRLERFTQEFIQKPYALNIFPTKKQVQYKEFSVRLTDETIALAAMKKADGREGFLFRLVNNTNESVETALNVQNATLPLRFGKFEVKTVLYENGDLTECDEMMI